MITRTRTTTNYATRATRTALFSSPTISPSLFHDLYDTAPVFHGHYTLGHSLRVHVSSIPRCTLTHVFPFVLFNVANTCISLVLRPQSLPPSAEVPTVVSHVAIMSGLIQQMSFLSRVYIFDTCDLELSSMFFFACLHIGRVVPAECPPFPNHLDPALRHPATAHDL